MKNTFKWTGFALVAAGIAVFPFAIWFPGPWGVISLLVVMAGCFLLVLSLKGSGASDGESAGPEDSAGDGPDQPGR